MGRLRQVELIASGIFGGYRLSWRYWFSRRLESGGRILLLIKEDCICKRGCIV